MWNDDEGWGVIDSADTPDGCWTFYSALYPDEVLNAQPGDSFSIGGGIRGLDVGEQVDFEWEPVIDQGGYTFRAIKARPRREIPPWHVKRIGRLRSELPRISVRSKIASRDGQPLLVWAAGAC